MITLTKRFEFEASHYLTGMEEHHACATEHSHTYSVDFMFQPRGDLINGLIVDTGRIRRDLQPVINRVKDKCLNMLDDPAPWSLRLAAQPSVEHFAMYFWDACTFLKIGKTFELISVRVYESPMIWAEVGADNPRRKG